VCVRINTYTYHAHTWFHSWFSYFLCVSNNRSPGWCKHNAEFFMPPSSFLFYTFDACQSSNMEGMMCTSLAVHNGFGL